jgi:hypothetical protein
MRGGSTQWDRMMHLEESVPVHFQAATVVVVSDYPNQNGRMFMGDEKIRPVKHLNSSSRVGFGREYDGPEASGTAIVAESNVGTIYCASLTEQILEFLPLAIKGELRYY